MSDAKHTPGPWEAVPDHAQTLKEAQPYDPPWVRAGMRPVAVCHNGGSWGPVAESEANAERIAACVNGCEGINPAAVADLAAACKIALEVLRRHDAGLTGCSVDAGTALDTYCGEDGLTDTDGVDGLGDVLRAALAKAAVRK